MNDYEPIWEPAGRDEYGYALTRCTLHAVTFGAVAVCPGCVFDNPKCPSDIERPDYWIDCPYPKRVIETSTTGYVTSVGWTYVLPPEGPGLKCTFHDRHFRLDEACARCLDDDEVAA